MEKNDTQNLPEHIVTYLCGRGISLQTLNQFNIAYDERNERIIIPVTGTREFYDYGGDDGDSNSSGTNDTGNTSGGDDTGSTGGDDNSNRTDSIRRAIGGTVGTLFNKYRRDPASVHNAGGPKYTYDSGSKAYLFGIHSILPSGPVVVCEGELDVLLLNTLGYSAVSSTGGCGTFRSWWGDALRDREVVIVFDHDEAGYRGALKVQGFIPHARIAWLPDFVGDHGDITDYFLRQGTKEKFDQLLAEAKQYPMPGEDEQFTTDECKANIALAEQARRSLADRCQDTDPVDIYIELMTRMYKDQQVVKKKGPISDAMMNDIERAKSVPIDSLIRFDRGRKAKSLWKKDERTPSMHYYPKSNRVKCFATGNHGDAIDVVMLRDNVTFKEAVDYLLNK